MAAWRLAHDAKLAKARAEYMEAEREEKELREREQKRRVWTLRQHTLVEFDLRTGVYAPNAFISETAWPETVQLVRDVFWGDLSRNTAAQQRGVSRSAIDKMIERFRNTLARAGASHELQVWLRVKGGVGPVTRSVGTRAAKNPGGPQGAAWVSPDASVVLRFALNDFDSIHEDLASAYFRKTNTQRTTSFATDQLLNAGWARITHKGVESRRGLSPQQEYMALTIFTNDVLAHQVDPEKYRIYFEQGAAARGRSESTSQHEILTLVEFTERVMGPAGVDALYQALLERQQEFE